MKHFLNIKYVYLRTESTHTDNIAGGDLLDVAVTPGSTALVIIMISATFAASTNTITRIGVLNGATSTTK